MGSDFWLQQKRDATHAPTPEDVTSFYESLEHVYAPSDHWLAISHRWIQRFIDQEWRQRSFAHTSLVLNLGSAGLSYGLPEPHMVHVDLHSKRFRSDQNLLVADIQNLPALGRQFNGCLCVGSVLNHCDAAAVIAGIARILGPDGELILEFETSGSFELLTSGAFGKSATVISTFYQDRRMRLWAYSESYVRKLLAANGFEITRRSSCHHLSPLVYLLSQNSNFAARFHVFDKLMRQIPGLRRCASHVIYACRRRL